MTAQDKAKEIIRKFYLIGVIECKQCALIVVDELIEETDYYFWKEVKKEIEKL